MKDLINSGPHLRTWLLPLTAVIWNQAVYYGGGWLARGAYHYDWTLSVDQAIPFLPWTVSVYFLCYLFWAGNYMLGVWQAKQYAYRFSAQIFCPKGSVWSAFSSCLPPTSAQRWKGAGCGRA